MAFFYLKFALLFCIFSVADALFFNGRVNCLVSSWTEWSEPNNYDQRVRTCRILRMPSGGGLPCPHIREVKAEGCNCTSWSGWSGLFGFGQNSRTRTWLEGPRATGGYSVCSKVEEEDIRYMGVKLDVATTAVLLMKSFVNGYYPPIPNDQITEVRDIVLILDSSGSIGSTNFKQAKEDVKSLFGVLCPINKTFDADITDFYQHQQLAMLTYSSTVEDNFFFNTYRKTSYVLNAISQARYHGSLTNTAEAFRKAQDMFQTSRGARESDKVKREVLILTDGLSNTGGDAVAAAEDLSKVAQVYGLMIGKFSAAGMTELTKYVSMPASKHLFNLENFNSLTELVEGLKYQLKLTPDWCESLDQD